MAETQSKVKTILMVLTATLLTLNCFYLIFLIFHSTWESIILGVSSSFPMRPNWYEFLIFSIDSECILSGWPPILCHSTMAVGSQDLQYCSSGCCRIEVDPFRSSLFHYDFRERFFILATWRDYSHVYFYNASITFSEISFSNWLQRGILDSLMEFSPLGAKNVRFFPIYMAHKNHRPVVWADLLQST